MIPILPGQLSNFSKSRSGNVAIIFGLLCPLLILLVGGGFDYTIALTQRQNLQAAADAAALAGAQELTLADSNTQNVSSIVDTVVSNYIAMNAQSKLVASQPMTVTPTIINSPNQPLQVQVQIDQNAASVFNIIHTRLHINAVAVVVGKPNICVLALDPSSMGTIYLQKNAAVIGKNCAVFSNSTHPNGIKAFNSSVLSASVICSAGGHNGGSGNFTPSPIDDCPPFKDPLQGRVEPNVGACTGANTNTVITSQTVTLAPGTYCGGLKINGSSIVTFLPGIYVIANGPLYIDQTATINGTNTGFYLTGTNATLFFNTGTTVNLTAPKDGLLAGILFFASPLQIGLTHQILSNNAHQLLGTIYLPTGILSIDANQPIADLSAYTAIVALKITANSGPTITLNSNYTLTDVPVPDGIRGVGQPTALVQ